MSAQRNISFVFFHYGPIPNYLRHAIESARFFNPDSRIILACDSHVPFPLTWNVEVINYHHFETPELQAFRKVYVHISTFKERYERFVLERWFYLTEIIKRLQCNDTVTLDSDLMVFQPLAPFFKYFQNVAFGMQCYSPHLTFVRTGVEGFLEHIMARYTDPAYLVQARERFTEARKQGGLRNLGEMEFVLEYLLKAQNVEPYSINFPEGHLDSNINEPHGCVNRKVGRRFRKCVYWEYQNGCYIPSLRDINTHAKIPVVTLHFQGPAKKLMRRFNPVGDQTWLSPEVRCKYLNFHFNRFSRTLPSAETQA